MITRSKLVVVILIMIAILSGCQGSIKDKIIATAGENEFQQILELDLKILKWEKNQSSYELKTLRKTADQIILEIKKLPPDEQRKIVDYVESTMEEYIETCYSPEDMAIIDRRDEDTRKGVNMESFSSMSEARKSLRSLSRAGDED